jgi:hypothetical protein
MFFRGRMVSSPVKPVNVPAAQFLKHFLLGDEGGQDQTCASMIARLCFERAVMQSREQKRACSN